MLCTICKNENPGDAKFCSQCGAPLKVIPDAPPAGSKWGTSLAIILVICVGFILYFQYFLSDSRKQTEKIISPLTSPVDDSEDADSMSAEKSLIIQVDNEAGALKKIPVGRVIIMNRWGKEIARLPSAVAGGAWVALPVKTCLGGEKWIFRSEERPEARIEGGIWRGTDTVGLWRLEYGQWFDSPEIFPWTEDQPLEWLSLETGKRQEIGNISSVIKDGLFRRFSSPEINAEPGVFIQDSRIVGWSFGKILEGGFLWVGPAGEGLDYKIKVEQFYKVTFADGREEQFSKALSLGDDVAVSERLEALAEGFRLSPKLADKDRPLKFQHESILRHMNYLVGKMKQKKMYTEISDILNTHILLEVSDVSLLLDAVMATAGSYGIESAVQLAEEVGETLNITDPEKEKQLNELHLQLYKTWIQNYLANRDTYEGWRVYYAGVQYFPDDPGLHFLGIELALAENNWSEAEQLLRVRNYPKDFADRVSVLESEIAEIKGEEGKIVIRFTPGARQIPVDVLLNNSVHQHFLVDTGASIVTIPSSTVNALRIKIDGSPERTVSTAGGMRTVREVIIPSIELDGWVERNIRAFVLDIPGNPESGLLGLNYLHRFHMEINNEKGILVLKPR